MHRCLTMPSSSPPLKTAHYSPMLHNALLAVATAFSDNPAIKDPATRRLYADKARSCLESECELPKLSAMTALSILANYHSSTNHPTLGYIYFGISARMSQALGLGIDCSPWVEAGLITEAGMLDRNWALWATFCQVRPMIYHAYSRIDVEPRILRGLSMLGANSAQARLPTLKSSQYRSSRPTWIHIWATGRPRIMKPPTRSPAPLPRRAL